MNKFAFIILICSATAIADRPEWYPENSDKINDICIKKYPVIPDVMNQIRYLHLEESPNMPAFLYCLVTTKSVFRPELGLEPERMHLAMNHSFGIDCSEDLIQECGSKHQDKSDKAMFFSILKCILGMVEEHCKRTA